MIQAFRSRHALAAAVVCGMAVCAPLTALAASDSGDSAKDSATQKQTDFTDKQLKQFVAAQNNVQSVIEKWDPKVADASKDKKADVQREENKALAKAVTSSGLKPDTYNAIAQQAQNNPELTKRIQSFMTPE